MWFIPLLMKAVQGVAGAAGASGLASGAGTAANFAAGAKGGGGFWQQYLRNQAQKTKAGKVYYGIRDFQKYLGNVKKARADTQERPSLMDWSSLY